MVETWDLAPSTCWWVSRTLILAIAIGASSSSPGAQAPGTGHRALKTAGRGAAFAGSRRQAGLPVHVVNVGAQRSLRSRRDAL